MSIPADDEFSSSVSGGAQPDRPAAARDESLVIRAVARLQGGDEPDRPAAARDREASAPSMTAIEEAFAARVVTADHPPLATRQNAVLAAGVVLVIAVCIVGGWAFIEPFRNPLSTKVAPSTTEESAPSVAELPPPVAEKPAVTDKSSGVTKPAEPTALAAVTDDLPKPREPQTLAQSQPSPMSQAAASPPAGPPAAVDDVAIDPTASELIRQGWALYYLPYTRLRWYEARRDFERALEVDSRSIEARIGLASILSTKLADEWSPVLQEDIPRAELLLREVIDNGNGSNAAAHFTLGVLRQMQNRLPEAQAEFEIAISLDHNNPRTYLHLGETLLYLGQPEAGIPLLEQAIRLRPDDPSAAIAYWALGSCQLSLGRVDQAIDMLQTARATNTRLWVPYFYLAGAYGLSYELDKARSAIAESIRLKPAVTSLAGMRVENPWLSKQQYWALQEKTLNVGLRRIGFADQ